MGRGTDDGRHETRTEQLDRNWTDLLQELRVIQTGVQLLTGFLLTLPFQQRFSTLDRAERGIYLTTAFASIVATVLLQAPVIVHRVLFRRHQRAETVELAHRLALAGIGLLGVAILGVSCLITSAVAGLGWATVTLAGVVLIVVVAWIALPIRARRAHSDQG